MSRVEKEKDYGRYGEGTNDEYPRTDMRGRTSRARERHLGKATTTFLEVNQYILCVIRRKSLQFFLLILIKLCIIYTRDRDF